MGQPRARWASSEKAKRRAKEKQARAEALASAGLAYVDEGAMLSREEVDALVRQPIPLKRPTGEKIAALAYAYGASEHKLATQTPLTATELTRDTCCALGVHSEGCGCGG